MKIHTIALVLLALLASLLGGCAKHYRNKDIWLTGPHSDKTLKVRFPLAVNQTVSSTLFYWVEDPDIENPVFKDLDLDDMALQANPGDTLFFIGPYREIRNVHIIAVLERSGNNQTITRFEVPRTFLYPGEPFSIDDIWLYHGETVQHGVIWNTGDPSYIQEMAGRKFQMESDGWTYVDVRSGIYKYRALPLYSAYTYDRKWREKPIDRVHNDTEWYDPKTGKKVMVDFVLIVDRDWRR